MTIEQPPPNINETEEESRAKNVEITKKAVEALRAKGINNNCQSCGKSNWNIYSFKIVATYASQAYFPAKQPLNLPVLNLTCLECGWMSLYSLKVLGVEV
ncbi:hypothetical protein HPP05_40630 [Corallococcus exiguus]|uniref:hypothetical protein n=1 Tax=Corallococcus exiguus TaxID=83462 RepID=UPI001494C534|nr:hypothetical protein [Corallococcus exiguus]NPC76053.1 hypothetical protein [Corallococcus exiguus]